MKSTRKSIAAVVAGTGFEGREEVIRRRCREGAPVTLTREQDNRYDPNAIAVWLHYGLVFGLIQGKRQIGYVKFSRAQALAEGLDSGQLRIERAFVRSFYAPVGHEHPRVSLQIDVVNGEA